MFVPVVTMPARFHLPSQYEPKMANEFGYVTDAVVMRKTGLQPLSRETDRLGFSTGLLNGYTPFKKRYPGVTITIEIIDDAWSFFLAHPTGEMHSNFRHPTTLDKRFAEFDFGDKQPGFLARILNWVRGREPSFWL